jgi:hypothetical protein
VDDLDQQEEQHRQHDGNKNPARAPAIEHGALGICAKIPKQ